MCQERLSRVASLTNPAGCNQLMRISSKANCQGYGRCPGFTGLHCGWKGLATWTLQETVSLPPGNFQRLKGSYIILATLRVLHFQVLEHLMRLSCMVCPAPYREKNCSWWSFARCLRAWGLRKHDYSPGCWSGEGLKFKDTKSRGGKKREYSHCCVIQTRPKMLWNLEEILFTAVFLNQGGGPWKDLVANV